MGTALPEASPLNPAPNVQQAQGPHIPDRVILLPSCLPTTLPSPSPTHSPGWPRLQLMAVPTAGGGMSLDVNSRPTYIGSEQVDKPSGCPRQREPSDQEDGQDQVGE